MPSLLEAALNFRQIVLQDTARVDVCAIPAAFDIDGSLLADSSRIKQLRRAECQARERSPRNGIEFTVERSVRDTVILAAHVTRGGLRYVERYHFVRKSGPVPVMTYSVQGWVHH